EVRAGTVAGGDVEEADVAVAAAGGDRRSVGGPVELLDGASAAADGSDRGGRVEVVLDELAAQRSDEELVGDGDERDAEIVAAPAPKTASDLVGWGRFELPTSASRTGRRP